MKAEDYLRLQSAAQAVIDRWETPLWKDAPATAQVIYALRDAAQSPTSDLAETLGEKVFARQLAEYEDVMRHRREIERLTAGHVELQASLNAEHLAHIARIERNHAEVCRLLTAILQAMPNNQAQVPGAEPK